jgi:hypothetical protein
MMEREGIEMEYGIEIMLFEFDNNFDRAIAYCKRQVWMAEINGNLRLQEEYSRLGADLVKERSRRLQEMEARQVELARSGGIVGAFRN